MGVTYHVVHRTEYVYEVPMVDGYTVARLTPRERPGQLVVSSSVSFDPVPDERHERVDAFGNSVVQVGVHHAHDRLTVTGDSVVQVESVQRPTASPPWEDVAAQLAAPRGDVAVDVAPFVGASQFVDPALVAPERPDATIGWGMLDDALAVVFSAGRPIADVVDNLCRVVFEQFRFDPGFSDVSTPLADVIEHRRGVCQDFAHVAAACLRSRGLAARYVSGYLETEPPPGEQKLTGADASHAWVSTWVPDWGWLDFDPTNNHVAPDRHVTVAWGRDYGDVAPVRGVVIGPGADQQMTVSVDVTRIA